MDMIGRHRPIVLGLSVGHSAGSLGSVGPFVRTSQGEVGFLSLAFGIAPIGAKPGDYVHQPGPRDADVLTGYTRIAKLRTIVRAKPDGISTTDCALAVLTPEISTYGNVVPEAGIDANRHIVGMVNAQDLTSGNEVAFVGRTSGLSIGEVTRTIIDDLEVHDGSATYRFREVIEVTGLNRAFCNPGDGGALVWRRSDMAAVGMVFAGPGPSDEAPTGYVLPITQALEAVNATLYEC